MPPLNLPRKIKPQMNLDIEFMTTSTRKHIVLVLAVTAAVVLGAGQVTASIWDENLRPFPLIAGQRGTVTCLDSPSISYDIYLPSTYSTSAAPLPILYTFNPGGGGMVSDFQAVCSNMQIITVGIINSANGTSLDIIYKDIHAVTRDIRQRVVFDPTAEMAAGFSGGGSACYYFSRFRPQHVAGIFAMGGWMGVADFKYTLLDRVQYNLLVARSTGTNDSGAAYYRSGDKGFLMNTCGAVVNDWGFTGGHEVAPDNIQTAALTWILTTRTMAGSNDRTNALAQANNWRTRISAGDRQAVLYEAAYALMDKPRSWYAYQAQLILDQLMNSTTFRTLDVADIARGDFANNHFYFSARGAALNSDWPTYHASMKALTGIMAIYGDRSADIYSLLQRYGFLTPVLTISHDSGQLNLSLSKDTPGLTYTLETSPNLRSGTWQEAPYPAGDTNTAWSAFFSIPEGSQRGFYRIRTTPTVVP